MINNILYKTKIYGLKLLPFSPFHFNSFYFSVDHLQLFGLQWQGLPLQWIDFVSLFRDLHILEMDRCNLEIDQVCSYICLSLFLFNICSFCIDCNVPRNTFTCQITHSKHLFARLRHSSWINHCYIPFDAPTGPIHQHRAWLSSRWTSGTVTSS